MKKEPLVVLTDEQIKICEASEKRIIKEYGKVERGFLSIAPDVARISALQGYTVKGYKNMQSYAEDTFGMKKSMMYGLIAIVQRFGDHESFEIRDKYKGLGFKHLNALLQLPEDKENLLPEGWEGMTAPELKKEVKALVGIEKKTDKEDKEETMEQVQEPSVQEKLYTADIDYNFHNDDPADKLLTAVQAVMGLMMEEGIEPTDNYNIKVTAI